MRKPIVVLALLVGATAVTGAQGGRRGGGPDWARFHH